MSAPLLTADELRRLLNYDPETGVFTWRVLRGPNAPAGSVAGCVKRDTWGTRNGVNTRPLHYHCVKISGRAYPSHRLAWLYIYEAWPTKNIDHIDGNGLNNAIGNLREATAVENQRNRGRQTNNTSGFKGVYWHKQSAKWAAQITINGEQKSLGYHLTKEEAAEAYRKAAERHFGAFAKPSSS